MGMSVLLVLFKYTFERSCLFMRWLFNASHVIRRDAATIWSVHQQCSFLLTSYILHTSVHQQYSFLFTLLSYVVKSTLVRWSYLSLFTLLSLISTVVHDLMVNAGVRSRSENFPTPPVISDSDSSNLVPTPVSKKSLSIWCVFGAYMLWITAYC